MSKKVLKYGVMFGAFSPILKKDFDIARRVMKVKNLDGIVFVPSSRKVDNIYGVDAEDKETLIKLAAQDYVNLMREDMSLMVSNCRILDGTLNSFKNAMARLSSNIEQSNINSDYFIKYIAIVDEDTYYNDEDDNVLDYEYVKYSKKPVSKDTVNIADIDNIDITQETIHKILKEGKGIPEAYMTGNNHAYFYLKACLDLD